MHDAALEDVESLRAVAAGNSAALGKLYDRHFRALRADHGAHARRELGQMDADSSHGFHVTDGGPDLVKLAVVQKGLRAGELVYEPR